MPEDWAGYSKIQGAHTVRGEGKIDVGMDAHKSRYKGKGSMYMGEGAW